MTVCLFGGAVETFLGGVVSRGKKKVKSTELDAEKRQRRQREEASPEITERDDL